MTTKPRPKRDNSKRETRNAKLVDWYRREKRDLPWRRTRDPYRILVSEVMLQQTQVERVIPYYERFLALFPDEKTLAAASDDAIHRAWKGLGYPSRVERLRAACAAVRARGHWPDTPEGLRELPGVGPYTSGAVACFAFGRAVPVVDTNIARVLCRRDGVHPPFDRDALWTRAATEVEQSGDAIAWTNALMELGATVCTARAPRCDACPWARTCRSRGDATLIAANATPMKNAAKTVRYGDAAPRAGLPRLRVLVALVHHDGRYLVARRQADAHQGGLWELPGGKREPGEDDRVALARELREELGAEVLAARQLLTWHHNYVDRAITFRCFRVRLFAPGAVQPLASQELRWVTPQKLLTLDMPAGTKPLIERMRRYHRL